ncbi:MAG: PQQ-binding-like beta-propeller repeat protein, partial [bacterium]|nr:PQQ-binding-like beta-propeller repeat protein [bacterium]
RMTITVATPVLHNGFLFVTSFYDGALLLKLAPDELAVEQVWRRLGPNARETDALHCCISTPILEGNHIYGVDSYGELRCLDLKTGDRIWDDLSATPKARWSNIHMVRNGEKIWMFNERGELIISTLSPRGFQEISRTKLIEPTKAQLSQRGGVCWSHPAFAYKRIYARNDEELVCADLSAPQAR